MHIHGFSQGEMPGV